MKKYVKKEHERPFAPFSPPNLQVRARGRKSAKYDRAGLFFPQAGPWYRHSAFSSPCPPRHTNAAVWCGNEGGWGDGRVCSIPDGRILRAVLEIALSGVSYNSDVS